MRSFKRGIGDIGEDIAVEFLSKWGFNILLRNYEKSLGEIDIIAKDKDGILVFFEVKTMRSSNFDLELIPEDNLSSFKLKKTKRICSLFAGKHSRLIDDRKGWRIDLLAITLDINNDRTKFKIKHYENI